MCANIHSQNGTAILAQELLSRKWENLKGIFLPTPSIRATAMSGAPVSFDRIIPEETQGPMPVEAPTTLASGSMDSFQHVEAVLKDDNVSTGTLDSQDWEMVTEMVEDTDNAATHFLQGKHVIDLEGPAPNLQDSIDTMMATMEKMRLGSTADGVEAPSRPEGVASVAAVPSADAAPMDDMVVEQTTHKWKVFGRGTSSPTFILAEVPFSMEAVTKDIKLMVDKLSTEEIFDLFVKFCDSESIPAVSFGRVVKAYVAMKAQKVHDEVMKQPHVAGRSRPGVGSDTLRALQGEDVCLWKEGSPYQEDQASGQHGPPHWQLAAVHDWEWHHLGARWEVRGGCSVCQRRCLIQIGQGLQTEACGGYWDVGRSPIVPSWPCRDQLVGLCAEQGQAPHWGTQPSGWCRDFPIWSSVQASEL